MKFRNPTHIAAVVILAFLPFGGSAAAAPLFHAGLTKDSGNAIEVRWRGRHHGYNHGWRHRHYGWGPTAGFAAGALIGSAIANSRAQAMENDAYCSRRFKSYDPASGTYLGYDGLRHPCP